MMNVTTKFLLSVGLITASVLASAYDGSHEDSEHNSKPDSSHRGESSITISDTMAHDSGIEVAAASDGVITEYLTTYGKIVTDPGHISHIGARFEGTVTDVKVTIGQQVKQGDILAMVEANQSLSRYSIRAPFDGIITARHANPGELAQKQPLFTVADYSFMWVELKVFPQDMSKVSAGQKVTLIIDDRRIQTTIDHLVPNDNEDPFILARASIENPENQLSAGMMAQGRIIINQRPVTLAVNKSALQTLNKKPVLFVKTPSGFEARPVTLGLQDDQQVEITTGLKVGEQYANKNSYTLKADLLKSGAKHAH